MDLYGKRGAATIDLARRLQPDILVDDRTGDGGDYATPEQTVGAFQMDRPWESCMTVSSHGQWSWGGASDGVKSASVCIGMLARCAGGDGNMLLDVGPRPDGIIDPLQAGLLKEIGQWTATNGDSIYGTRGGPFMPGKWGASTRKGTTIYIHILAWNGDALHLPAIPAKVISARALNGAEVKYTQSADGIALQVSPGKRDADDTVIALEIDRPAMDLAPVKDSSIGAIPR
jgi:alpha-L-fucosidase